MTWTVIGAPLNSSARPGGEELAPAVLRRAGLLERLSAEDGGDIAARVRPAERDPASGVLGLPGLLTAGEPDGPVIAPELVVVLGHRHPDDAEDTTELDLVDGGITRVDSLGTSCSSCSGRSRGAGI